MTWIDDIGREFWEEHLSAWYPRSISTVGFEEAFSEDWTPTPRLVHSAVYQARMTWMAATAGRHDPRYIPYALHGAAHLARNFVQPDGSVVWSVDLNGEAVEPQRHAYASAFTLYALAACSLCSPESTALENALRVFNYLEGAHRDPVRGGYWEVTDRFGLAVVRAEGTDAIGTPFGQKSQNTHLHLLEAYSELYRATPRPEVREAIVRLIEIFSDRLFSADGWLHMFIDGNLNPIPGQISHGHDIEAAHLLLDAAQSIGYVGEHVQILAQRLADYALATGWDAAGGFFNMGDANGNVTDRTKVWWVQAEGLLGLASVYHATQDSRYLVATQQQWDWIKTHQIDANYGGWWEAIRDGEVIGSRHKAHPWKAAYHDGRAMLFTHELLKSVR